MCRQDSLRPVPNKKRSSLHGSSEPQIGLAMLPWATWTSSWKKLRNMVLTTIGVQSSVPLAPMKTEELQAILLGYPALKLTIVRPAMQDDPLVKGIESDAKGPLWSVRMVAVRIQGSIASRRVIIQQYSDEAPNLKRAKVKATALTVPAPTVVVRVSTEKPCVTKDAFNVVLGKPGQIARAWLHHLGGRELTGKVSDSWGFRTENSGESTVVCGMMRVESSILPQLLSYSGKHGGGHRWFVDPVPRNGEHVVRWQKWTMEENWIHYANRLHNDAPKLGIVRGVSSLGIRCPKTELTAESKVRTWRIVSVPKDWLEAQVKQALTEVGLQAVQPLNKRPNGRHTCAWTVSAVTAPDVDFFEIATDNATIVATLLQSRPKSHTRETLPSEHTVRFKACKEPAIKGTVGPTDAMDTTETAETAETAEADQSIGTSAEAGRSKREATLQSVQQKRKLRELKNCQMDSLAAAMPAKGSVCFLLFRKPWII